MSRTFAALCLFCVIPILALAVQSTQFYPNGTPTQQVGPPYPTPPIQIDLGREIGGTPVPGAKLRYRMFAIIDRSNPVALEPGRVEQNEPGPVLTASIFALTWIPEGAFVESPAQNPVGSFPAQSALDFEIAVTDLCCDAFQTFVDLDGFPAGTYQELIPGPTSFDVKFRVDVGTGGYHELDTQCDCVTGYTMSNIAIASSGSTDSHFRVSFDMDGPGGAIVEPLLECTTTGAFFAAPPVSTHESTWGRIKSLFGE